MSKPNLKIQPPVFANAQTQLMVNFICEKGIEVIKATTEDDLPIPGITVNAGRMMVDEDRLTYPGDLLYQAGRIAVIPEEKRSAYMGLAHPDKNMEAAEGMAAMCWSWAALIHLNLAPEVVFHDGGYKGQSMQIIQGYQSGAYMGLPLLQLFNMAYEPHQAAARNLIPFPHMYKWLNDERS